MAQFFWRTGLGRRITFPVRGFRLHLHPANIAWQLWLDRHSRDDDMQMIHSLLRPGDIMIDVGANIGYTAIEGALAVGSAGSVHAIEPHPTTHRHLMENLALNHLDKTVPTYAVAITSASSPGLSLQFSDDRRDDMNALLLPGKTHPSNTVTVPSVTLDQLFSGLPRCDLLKVDVEGSDLHALLGAKDLLTRTRQILIEAGEPNSLRFGIRASDLHDHLVASGFQVTEASPDRAPVDLDHYRNHVGNWLAVNRSLLPIAA